MARQESFDLVVIGAGPGGYVACVRAAQLGFKVACVEKNRRLGGVCLNEGCIPSKALLDSSEYFHLAKAHFAEHGIQVRAPKVNLKAMMARKEQVVRELTDNVRKILEGNKIKIYHGHAKLAGAHEVEVSTEGNDASARNALLLKAQSILLATGSQPVSVPAVPPDGHRIVTSTEALSFSAVPKHLGIVGGGYIGLELGSIWNRLGAQVTIIELMPRIAPHLDGQIVRSLQRILAGQGIEFRLQTKVVSAEVKANKVRLQLQSDGSTSEMNCDRLLVAVGRKPLTGGLNLAETGVELDPQSGHVIIDSHYRTSVPSIYAIGDLVAGPMLAHKASAEGIAAVECMAGMAGQVNYDAIPAVIYTSPEVASVGMTEEEVKERGIEYCVGTYPFAGAGRARCMGETEGLVKMIARGKTDRVLGVHILGPRASDMIAECVLAMEFGGSSEDIARTVHAHPTFSEALHEAALAVRKCSIYAS